MLDIKNFYELLDKEKILFSYKGMLDGDLIDYILQMVDKRLKNVKIKKSVRKKVINVLVECIQNSYHYANQKDSEGDSESKNSSFIVVSQTPVDFIVYTGNYVSPHEAEKLDTQLEAVNAMDESDLREYYIKNLNKDNYPQVGGAGLGLVDISRRSGNKIIYNFDEISDDSLLFSMQVKVKN
jgi:hypothetical protein